MAEFTSIARDEFDFLISEYGYEPTTAIDSKYGGYACFVNQKAGVGVKVEYEYPVGLVFVFICKLVDGEIRENQLPITSESNINCFDVSDYLAPADRMKPAYEYDEDSSYFDPQDGLRNFAKEFATRLRIHGDSILRGDLSILPEMEKVIKMRAERFSNKDWE